MRGLGEPRPCGWRLRDTLEEEEEEDEDEGKEALPSTTARSGVYGCVKVCYELLRHIALSSYPVAPIYSLQCMSSTPPSSHSA